MLELELEELQELERRGKGGEECACAVVRAVIFERWMDGGSKMGVGVIRERVSS